MKPNGKEMCNTLSSVLLEQPQCFARSKGKILAKRKSIYSIDTHLLPRWMITHVVELNIAGNKLRSTKGIERFTNLRVLDLSYNLIINLHEVSSLAQMLSSLQSLNLRGNKLCDLPLVREYIIVLFPSITDLDGVEISLNTRLNTSRLIGVVDSNIRTLLATFETGERLSLLLKVITMHLELLRTVHRIGSGKQLVSSVFEVPKFLRIWQSRNCPREQNARRMALLWMAYKRPDLFVSNSLSRPPPTEYIVACWTKAFGEVARKLQQKVSKLFNNCERKASQLNTVKMLGSTHFGHRTFIDTLDETQSKHQCRATRKGTQDMNCRVNQEPNELYSQTDLGNRLLHRLPARVMLKYGTSST